MSRSTKAVLQLFVHEAVALRREHEPHVFSPLGAQIPYAWAHLQRWYRERYTRFVDAQQAALSLTRDDRLRTLYAETSEGRMWLEEQVENLARRSMMFASTEAQVGEYFDFWYGKFTRELNRSDSIDVAIYEVWGLRPARKSKYQPLTDWSIDPIRAWIQRGDIAETADGLGTLLPPALLGHRFDRPEAIFVAIRSRPKTERSLASLGGYSPEEVFQYRRAAQLHTGVRVDLGSWMTAEISPFPRNDSHLFERETPRAPWGQRAVVDLTPQVHRRIRSLQGDIRRIPRGFRERRSSISYALNKYERIARLDGYWSDAVVDAVSVFESLFSTDDERNARIADRMTWLSGLTGSTAEDLLGRVRLLFRVRNDVIHAGKVDDETLAKAIAALGGVVARPTPQDPYPESRYDEIWYSECHPRLLMMLRWAIEFALKTEGELTRPVLRAIDDSIVLGHSNRTWVRRARGIGSPIAPQSTTR